MTKRGLDFVIVVTAVAMLLVWRHRPGPASREERTRRNAEARAAGSTLTPVESAPPVATHARTFEARILELGGRGCTAGELAALLKSLHDEDPDRLFKALLAIGRAPPELQRAIVPLLADALTLWPEAEGRYVFPVADAYGDLDLSAAAEWAAGFLRKTGRNDIAAATLLARLAQTSEGRALDLIAGLPKTSRLGAMDTLAYHLALGDLNHLMEVCRTIDPNGSTSFPRQLFERLGAERLDDTAAWFTRTPEAQRIRGAAAAIGQALVNSGNPRRAITWADSLSDPIARAEAITAVYRRWAQNSPQSAIGDIQEAYGGAPELMTDVFRGAAEHHGSGAASHWDLACNLKNPSARAYAISALIAPMLVTVGPVETEAKIATLAPGSLERNVAELTLSEALVDPAVASQLKARFDSVATASNRPSTRQTPAGPPDDAK